MKQSQTLLIVMLITGLFVSPSVDVLAGTKGNAGRIYTHVWEYTNIAPASPSYNTRSEGIKTERLGCNNLHIIVSNVNHASVEIIVAEPGESAIFYRKIQKNDSFEIPLVCHSQDPKGGKIDGVIVGSVVQISTAIRKLDSAKLFNKVSASISVDTN
jgi:hypothetical protein